MIRRGRRRRSTGPPALKSWSPGDADDRRGRDLALGWALASLVALWIVENGVLARAPAAATHPGWSRWLATGGLLAVANGLFAVYLRVTHAEVLRNRTRLALAMGLGLLTLLGARLLAAGTPVVVHAPGAAGGASPQAHLALFTPMVLTALVLTVATGPRFAAEASGLLLFQVALVVRHPSATAGVLGFLGTLGVLAVLGAGVLVAVLGARRIGTRSRLVNVGIGVGVAQAGVVVLFALPWLGDLLRSETSWALLVGADGGVVSAPVQHVRLAIQTAAWDAGLLLAHGLVLGLLVSGALPFIEYCFDVVTDISLLELSNQDHPLLRRLLLLAPGTFHHSFVVGNLVEAGAEAIGANALLGRVGAYFHDVGKSVKPEYFTENEGRKGLKHGRLSPTLSALVIKAHTKDGVSLAREYNLPEQIIEFIPQHHGTSVIEFFYQEALSQEAAEGAENPHSFVNRDAFRHDGPKPQNKETAIMHLADSVEAATRSLSDPTPSRLGELTHDIIWSKLEDGQLDECDLTFRDLRAVEEAFVRVLMGIFHTRIAYPERRMPVKGRTR